METHAIESNGQKFNFSVVKNTTEPCPECGVPACGKEDILWYENKGQRIAVILDGGHFDLAGVEFFENNTDALTYDSLPVFMKEWNESKGWADCSDYAGYTLEIDDFLKSLELLKHCGMGKWITQEDISSMEELANNALRIGAKLKIARG